jgi:tetratricopeptide (TPR) repeat protein
LGYLHAALQQAMEQQNNEDLGYALFGLASAFRDTKRFKESMALIHKLEVVLEVLNIRRLKYATHVLKSNLFREQGDFQKALESLGKANDVIREEKSLFYHIHTQRFLGRIYKDMGQKNICTNVFGNRFKNHRSSGTGAYLQRHSKRPSRTSR